MHHGLFCVPKEGGGGRAIVDCSQPIGGAVNNYTNKVAITFSYKSVNTVVSVLERGDYMAIIDIADAYWALPIHYLDEFCLVGSTYEEVVIMQK